MTHPAAPDGDPESQDRAGSCPRAPVRWDEGTKNPAHAAGPGSFHPGHAGLLVSQVHGHIPASGPFALAVPSPGMFQAPSL